MRDPYQVLGVSKSATAEELKSTYRKLAKKLHPDVNPGRKDIEQKFKEVTAAYDLLSDKTKRARFDRGEIDGMGNERAYSNADTSGFGSGGGGWRGGFSGGGGDAFAGYGGAEDIFAEFMSGMRGGGNKQRGQTSGAGPGPGRQNVRGPDVTYSLAIPFVDACLGGKKRLTLSSGKTIDVTIPPATEEGNKLRLRGLGMPGLGGGAGDAIIEMHIEPHPYFTRQGNDLQLEVPVSLQEAVLGASVKVPTLDGHVTVKVPKGANSGTTLRLKGKGVALPVGGHGDMFVKLKLVLPEQISDDLTSFVEKWAKQNQYDPRRKLGWD